MKATGRGGGWLTIAGFAILAVPLVVQGLWIVEFNRHETQAERVAAYLAHFPPFARNATFLGLGPLVLCVAAGAVLVAAALYGRGVMRALAILGVLAAVVLGILLGLLNLFQAL